ncbi:MAG: NAD(P)H-dependent oxidoreductase [Phycisphaerae bacterium]|nr:NAD(P)H-dependent oxidoreductase [Phycisphaerae bacterium]
MARVLVIYFSVTGNTKTMADAVVRGVTSVEGAECILMPAAEVTNQDWVAADAIIVGSPTYFGQMAAEVKHVIDATAEVYGQLEGKIGAAFTSSGGAGCGHELTNMSIITALLVSGMVVQGTTHGPHFGPFAVGKPTAKDLEIAETMGVCVARLTVKLFG